MNKLIFLIGIGGMLLIVGCNKEKKSGSCESPSTCYTCTNCQGQYGHLINGQYCVSGFDNCEDWQAAKTNYENNDGCDCEFN